MRKTSPDPAPTPHRGIDNSTLFAKRLLAIFLMYAAQGIPAGLAFNAFSTILRHGGASLHALGLTGLLFLPWALKCLWSSMADNVGKRWGYGKLALWTHITAVLLCLFLIYTPPEKNFVIALIGIFLLNTLFATQDIFTNACAVSHMKGRNAGLANAVQVIAFLLGMVAGGSGSLVLYAHYGWHGAMLGMACALLLLWVALLPLRACIEPLMGNTQPPPSRLLTLFEQAGFLWAATMALSFKFAGSALSLLLQPWLMDSRFTLEFAGTLQMSNILCGAIGGAVIGFPTVRLMGSNRAVRLLIWPSTLLLGTLWLLPATGMASPTLLYIGLGVENFVDGGFYVSIWAMLMNWSSTKQPGTDYSFLQCGESLTNVLAGLSIPPLASMLGYSGTFLALWGMGACVLPLLVLASRKLDYLCSGEHLSSIN